MMEEFNTHSVPAAIQESVSVKVAQEVKKRTSSLTHEYPRWLDGQTAEYTDYTWVTRSDTEDRFNEVVNTYPDEPEDREIEPDNSTLTNRYMSKAEYEYNMDQMTISMSDDMDWALDHGLGIESKDSLPLIGTKLNQRIPLKHFFNEDLEILKTGNKDLKNRKYAYSVTKRHAVEYKYRWIEKDIGKLWRKTLVNYDMDAMLGIQHYEKIKRLAYRGKSTNTTPGKFIRGDEVYKFFHGTLTDVRDQLASLLRMNQVEKKYQWLNYREWSNRDVQRSKVMLRRIEAVLKERRQMRRLEVYVGGRPKTEDIRLFVRHE
ncbi:hypothetical protein Tco_0126875 [Tanacetum coccineum]